MSSLTASVIPSIFYYIHIDGFEGASGPFLLEVTSGAGVSVQEEVEDIFSVFPNPTDGNVTITSAQDVDSVALTNLVGAVVSQNNNITQGAIQVDLSNLASGLYLMTVEVEGRFYTQRVTKK